LPSSAPTGRRSRSPPAKPAPQHPSSSSPPTAPPHPTPNPPRHPATSPHKRSGRLRHPLLVSRHRQRRRHRLQPLPRIGGRVHAVAGQPDRAARVDRLHGPQPRRRHLLLPGERA
jgi:hypothetical protein